MSESLLQALSDALRPVGSALLARSRGDADRVLADVDAEAAGLLARAEAEAEAILSGARAEGAADAAGVLVAERARARRQARAIVLAAQREAFEELRRQVLSDLPELRNDPSYPVWRDGLGARVHAVLGADAVVTEPPEGGVAGEVAGRRVAFTLVGLVDQGLDALGSDVEGLWSG